MFFLSGKLNISTSQDSTERRHNINVGRQLIRFFDFGCDESQAFISDQITRKERFLLARGFLGFSLSSPGSTVSGLVRGELWQHCGERVLEVRDSHYGGPQAENKTEGSPGQDMSLGTHTSSNLLEPGLYSTAPIVSP